MKPTSALDVYNGNQSKDNFRSSVFKCHVASSSVKNSVFGHHRDIDYYPMKRPQHPNGTADSLDMNTNGSYDILHENGKPGLMVQRAIR